MELRHLRYFTAVAENLNFSEASRRIHVAQPAISQPSNGVCKQQAEPSLVNRLQAPVKREKSQEAWAERLVPSIPAVT